MPLKSEIVLLLLGLWALGDRGGSVGVWAQSSPLELLDSYRSVESIMPGLAQLERHFADEPCEDRSDKKVFDFVVVGAGAAGCVMANRLTEISKWNVLLLEAGQSEAFALDIPFISGAYPDTDWKYTSAAQAHGGCPLGPEGHCPYPRGFVMGGSTTLNAMMFVRGNRKDYDHWAALGNTGWDYDSVLPYFKKMESVQVADFQGSPYRGNDGPIKVSRPYETALSNLSLEAARALGIPEVDYNGAQQEGIGRMQATTFRGARWSANSAYVNGLRRRNLFLRKGALVTRLLTKWGRVVGVEYVQDGETHSVYAKKEVILSAGAINSPKILMLSGIGPKDHLQQLGIPLLKDLPVGRTLYDHSIFLGLVITLNTSITLTRLDILSNLSTIAEYFVSQTGPLSALSFGEVLRFFEVGDKAKNVSWPNFELMVSAFPTIFLPTNSEVLGLPEEFYNQFCIPLLSQPVIQPHVILLRPKSVGSLELQDKNISSIPLIDPNYFSEEEDVNKTVEAIKHAIELYTSGPFAELGAKVYDTPIPRCSNFSFGSYEYWSCAVRWGSTTIYDPSSTCKMGPGDDPTAVVSPDLKVWGVEGIRVVDASIMPMIPAAHLQAPTYMIAEKGADLVKCEHIGRRYCHLEKETR